MGKPGTVSDEAIVQMCGNLTVEEYVEQRCQIKINERLAEMEGNINDFEQEAKIVREQLITKYMATQEGGVSADGNN